jgi:hypothetical protein
LLTQQDKRSTRRDADMALRGILEQRWSEVERRRAVDEELSNLEQAGHIARVNVKRKTSAVALTQSGQRAALEALGIEALPPKTTWRSVLKTYLLAQGIGLRPPKTSSIIKRFHDTDGLRAAILASHHRLNLGEYPTLKQVRDALAWRAMGVEANEPLTLKAVLKVLLNRELGTPRPQEPEKALEWLAARAAGARRAGANELQMAVLRRWLNGPELAVSSEAPGARAAEPQRETAGPPEDDRAFAVCVLTAARTSKTGRFGDSKVFISHVFRRLADEGVVADDPDAFKARLVSAHLRGLLSLSRADLVEAMAPEDVRASEAQEGGSTFHFVRVQP